MKDMVTRGMKEVYINDELYAKNKEIIPIEFQRHSELEADILKIIGIIQKKL
jgi:hypothetical protein